MTELSKMLKSLAIGETLSQPDAARAFQIILNGGATPAQIGAYLMGLQMRSVTVEELVGGVEAMRRKCHPFKAPENAIDVCGTGGDGIGTLNISTAASLVVSACGVPVAKHGNRGISSPTGSSDVFASLGVNLNADFSLLEECINKAGIAFLLASRFHAGMRHVTPVRSELGFKTVFNMLGPLTNPAGVKRQIIGVYSKAVMDIYKEALLILGCEKVWLLHGSDGIDEITISGKTIITEIEGSKTKTFEIKPEDFGIASKPIESIKGGDTYHNTRELEKLLNGHEGAYRDTVLLNSAAALIVAGKVQDMQSGIALAAKAIDSGAAKDKLAAVVQITNNIAPTL